MPKTFGNPGKSLFKWSSKFSANAEYSANPDFLELCENSLFTRPIFFNDGEKTIFTNALFSSN